MELSGTDASPDFTKIFNIIFTSQQKRLVFC